MNERIFSYLRETGKGIAADQILSDLLGIRSPTPGSADRILAGLLKDDHRFVFIEGLWHLRPLAKEPGLFDSSQAVVLHLQGTNRADLPQGLRGAVRLPDGCLREFTASLPLAELSRLRSEIEGYLLILWSRWELQLWNSFLRSFALEACRGDKLYLQNLAARSLKRKTPRLQPDELAQELGLSPPDEERPREVAQYLHACWLLLLDHVPAEFRRDLKSLGEWMDAPRIKVDFSRFAFGPKFLRELPGAPGIYMMKNRAGTPIYVGKSRNLRRRVSSYFTPRALGDPKTVRIHKHLHSIDICTTDNEIEALLMEMRMIKDFSPPINLQTEIHERQSDYGRNLLLFVVEAGKDRVQIYFLYNGIFAGKQPAPLGSPPSKRLNAKVQSVFFKRGKSRKPRAETWEKEIVFRWFAANRNRLNYLDIDQSGDLESVVELLGRYLCDPDKLANKVYYR